MSCSRKFKSQTWFVRFPTNEIEVLDGEVVECALRAGTVDARTPLRSVGAHMWTTLGEAAGLDKLPSPTSLLTHDGDVDSLSERSNDDAPWRLGSCSNERFEVGKGRLAAVTAALFALGAIIACVGCATSPSAVLGVPVKPVKATQVAITSSSFVDDEPAVAAPSKPSRLTKDQVRHLEEVKRLQDAARKQAGDTRRFTGGSATTSRTSVMPPTKVKRAAL